MATGKELIDLDGLKAYHEATKNSGSSGSSNMIIVGGGHYGSADSFISVNIPIPDDFATYKFMLLILDFCCFDSTGQNLDDAHYMEVIPFFWPPICENQTGTYSIGYEIKVKTNSISVDASKNSINAYVSNSKPTTTTDIPATRLWEAKVIAVQ